MWLDKIKKAWNVACKATKIALPVARFAIKTQYPGYYKAVEAFLPKAKEWAKKTESTEKDDIAIDAISKIILGK